MTVRWSSAIFKSVCRPIRYRPIKSFPFPLGKPGTTRSRLLTVIEVISKTTIFKIKNVISLYYETKSIDWICIFHGSRKIFFKIKPGKEP